MNTLIAQHESEADETGRTYGVEVFHDPAEGFYTARCHIRTYDGVRVESSWSSGEVRLESHGEAGARREAGVVLADFRASLSPAL